MALHLAFIKLNALLFVFHRFQKELGLFFTHLALFFRFGPGYLRTIFRWLRLFVAIRAFDFAGQFFLRRGVWRRRRRRVSFLAFAFTWRRRWQLILASARGGRFFRLFLTARRLSILSASGRTCRGERVFVFPFSGRGRWLIP